MYVGGVLDLRKLDFRGLKGQFDVGNYVGGVLASQRPICSKNTIFRGIITNIGYLWFILASKPMSFLINYIMERYV